MNTRRQIMVCMLAFSLIATLGAIAAKDFVPAQDLGDNAFWIKTTLSDDLLASRLSVTNAVKLHVETPVTAPAEDSKTAQLIR